MPQSPDIGTNSDVGISDFRKLSIADVDVMSENYDVMVIFLIFGQFGAIPRPDSGHRVCKVYVFCNRNLLQKLKTELKNF